MKLSVSLSAEDVSFVDSYLETKGMTSRSSVLQRAVALLREAELEDAYASAWDEWAESEDATLWDTTTGDGLSDASR